MNDVDYLLLIAKMRMVLGCRGRGSSGSRKVVHESLLQTVWCCKDSHVVMIVRIFELRENVPNGATFFSVTGTCCSLRLQHEKNKS